LLQTGICAIALALPAGALAQTMNEEPTPGGPNQQAGQRQSTKSSAEHKELTPEETRLVVQLHHVNQMEIEAGKLAATKSTNANVKQYGNRLVRDHSAADMRVTAFAKQRDLNLESAAQAQNPEQRAAMQKHQAMMDKLTAASGADFDREFLSAMATGHEEVISQVQDAQSRVQDPQLKALVDRLLPQLQQHRDTARRLLEAGD
jgi:putative membrane protein